MQASHSLSSHVIESLDVVVSLGLVCFLEFGEARALSVDGLEVVSELLLNLVLRGDDEHAADAAENLLRALHFVDGLEGDFCLDLLALCELERAVGHAELLDSGQEVALVLTELHSLIKLSGALTCLSAIIINEV